MENLAYIIRFIYNKNPVLALLYVLPTIIVSLFFIIREFEKKFLRKYYVGNTEYLDAVGFTTTMAILMAFIPVYNFFLFIYLMYNSLNVLSANTVTIIKDIQKSLKKRR